MIHEPISVGSDDSQSWYSVTVALPPDVDKELRDYAQIDGDAWTVQAHAALYQYRASFMTKEESTTELDKILLDSLGSGPAIEVTPAYWKSLKKEVLERHHRIQDLKAKDQIGNLLLPVELYEFVKAKIASQEFFSPTEVVLAAMPFLRAWRAQQIRHESLVRPN